MAHHTIYLSDDNDLVGMDWATAWSLLGEEVQTVRRTARVVHVVVDITEQGVIECAITATMPPTVGQVRLVGAVSAVQEEGSTC